MQALQLLEFLIKNGSERVIDDARSHLSLLKMLKQFHYIDQNGKDQGVNVRNRSKELAELLSDVERIRAERKKARTNRNKFGGVAGGAMSGGLSGGSRYGGFGSEEGGYGGYSGGVYGDGGGFGGNTSGFQDSSRRDRFEEYDEYDEGAVAAPSRRKTETTSPTSRDSKKPELPKKKEPEIDILNFDDDIPPETPPKEFMSNGKRSTSNPMDNGFGALQSGETEDDDFDDFQSATPASKTTSNPPLSGIAPPTKTSVPLPSTQFAAPTPVPASQGTGLNSLVGFSSISPTPSSNSMVSPLPSSFATPTPSSVTSPSASAFSSPPPISQQQPKTTGYQAAAPNYFTSVPVVQAASPGPGAKSPIGSIPSFNKPAQPKPSVGGDAFGSLWSTASASAGIKKTPTPSNQGPRLADLAKEKTSAGIWGANAPTTSTAQPSAQSQSGQKFGGLDDLL